VLTFGPYETISRIAAGGMGEVFVARRTGAGAFEKKVALKVLLPHLSHDREFVERFFDEARLVARMNHPNIVQIFDVGETDGRPWLAMALVEAVSLQRLIKAHSARDELLPLPMARLIATGLLEGLAYAHALKGPRGEPLNVVHRDITPSNILVSLEGAVLLTDFGIAKSATNVHQTQPGGLRGKLAYLAPEALTQEGMDQRSDLFSAATTLVQLLSGASIFKRDTDTATMDAVMTAVHPRVTQLRPDVTPGMATALERALQRAKADRFTSAKEMREAFCDGAVASAPQLGEWVRRLCPDAGTPFRDKTTLTPPAGGGTASLPIDAPFEVQSDTLPNNRPLWSRLLVGVLGVGALAALGIIWTGRAPGPAEVEPVVVAPPPAQLVAELEAPDPMPPPEPAPSEPPRAAAHPPRLAARVPTVKPAPPDPAPMRIGYLTADASPWATVLFDGKTLDRTPLSRFPVPSGSHTLTFRSADGRELKRPVQIEEGQVHTVRVDFSAP
jgi:serine/threonine-protein kinase